MDEFAQSIKQKTDDAKTQTWSRLSPIAIIYFAVSAIKQIAGNIVYILPGLAVGYSSFKENPFLWLPMAIIFVGLVLFFSLLNFYFYRYRLTKDNVEIRQGVFFKKHINLPFSRIQNVKLEQPIFYRATHYTCMQLDTAGSAQQEAKIVALPMQFAQQLKQQIMAQHNHQTSSVASDNLLQDSPNTISNEQVINRRSIKDLIIHGLTNNRVWIILGALAPMYDKLASAVSNFLLKLGFDLNNAFSLEAHAWWQVGLYAISLTMIIMLIMTMASIAGSIVVFYDFTLSKLEDRYIRRSGLFNKQEVSIKLSRIQMIISKQDWLDVLLKRINLQLEQNSASTPNANGLANTNKIVVPSVTPSECRDIIEDTFPNSKLNDVHFTAISKRFILRAILIWLLPLTIVAGTLLTISQQYSLLPIMVALSLALALLVLLRWYRWGYAKDDSYIYIRKGLFGIDYYCFPIYKIQQTKYRQSFLMKPKQLASVTFVLASGSMSIPFMSQIKAFSMINDCLYQLEKDKVSWM